MTSRLPRYEAKCVQRRCFQCGSVALRSDIKGTELPPANILIPLERQLIALQLCRWEFLYNETLQQTFRPLLSKLSKIRQIYVLYPHFDEVRGGVEPCLMARWKAPVEFLLRVIELLFLSLTAEALQGKMSQNSLPSAGGRSLRDCTPGREPRSVAASFILWFLLLLLSSSSSFLFPRLISAVAEWMSTIWCGLSADLDCRSEMCWK